MDWCPCYICNDSNTVNVPNTAPSLFIAHPLFLAHLMTFTSRFMKRIPPPSGSSFFHFHAVFGKNWPKNRLMPPTLWAHTPLSGCSRCSQIMPSAKIWSCAHVLYLGHLWYDWQFFMSWTALLQVTLATVPEEWFWLCTFSCHSSWPLVRWWICVHVTCI